MRMTLLFPLLLALPAPALAGSFTAPEGCTTFMTVQARACRVSNHYKCTADAAGDQWRADFDQEGIFFKSKINADAEWVESYDLPSNIKQTLDPGAEDPASFSELLSSGSDTFAFNLSRENGEHTKVSGFDRMTGQSYVIDGITLQETEFEYTETDDAGTVLRQSNGREYIHPDWRLFFSGPSEWNGGDGEFLPLDGSPMQFIFPGEPGFASTQPVFECDAIMSSLPKAELPQAKESPSHDNL